MEDYTDLTKLDLLTKKYQLIAETNENWVYHLKAHGLANRCLALEFTEERQKRVYDIENCWYKGQHPLTYYEHLQLTQKHRELLNDYRKETRDDFNSIRTDNLDMDNLISEQQLSYAKEFTKSVFNLSQKCSDSFINVAKSFMESSVSTLSALGLSPPCSFAVIGLGSTARGTATPYSDLEYGFLVESEHYLEYFTKLAVDSYFKIGNMGESPLKCFNITEVGKTYTDKGCVGFRIDGISRSAGHIPTGKGNGQESLTLTIDQLSDFYSTHLYVPAADGDIAGIDDLLASTVMVYAHRDGEKLFNRVQETLHHILAENENRKHINKRLKLLTTDVTSYNFLPTFESFGPPDNTKLKVKTDIFRYPTLLADHLRLLIALEKATPWDVHRHLQSLNLISADECFRLNLVLALSVYIRTSAYLLLETQKDQLSLYPPMQSGLKKIYHVPRNVFLLLAFLFVPIKLTIAENIQNIRNVDITDKVICAKYILSELTSYRPNFTLKAEIQFYSGDYAQALDTLHKNFGKNIFDGKPEEFIVKMTTAVQSSASSQMEKSHHLPKIHRLAKTPKIAKTSTQYIEMAAYLLYSARNHACAKRYFLWLAAKATYSVSDSLKWKVLAADAANKLHEYHDAIPLIGDVHQAMVLQCHLEQSETLYSFVKEQTTMTDYSSSDKEFLEIVAQAFRVVSETYLCLKDYFRAEELANVSLKLFETSQNKESSHNKTSEPDVNLICSLAMIYLEKNEHDQCHHYLEHHLERVVAVHTDKTNHPDIALLLTGLGQLYENTCEYSKALHCYEKALAMMKALYIPNADHADIAEGHRRLATVQLKNKEYEQSLASYNIALQMFERLNTNDHDRTRVSVEIGILYSCIGDYHAALSHITSALDIVQAHVHVSSSQIDVGDIHTAFGRVYTRMNNIELALKHHTMALEITKEVLGSIESVPTFKQLHGEMGSFSLRLAAEAKMLNIEKISHEVNSAHPDIASSYLRIASAYCEMSLYDQSMQYVNKSHDMYKAIYGDVNHEDIASAYDLKGRVCFSMSEYSNALEHNMAALNMRLSIYGADTINADIATSYCSIGFVYDNLADYEKALEFFMKSLNMRLAVYGADAKHEKIAETYDVIGLVYNNMCEYSKSLDYYMKAVNMRLAVYGTDAQHVEIATSYFNIGSVYDDMGEYSKSLEYYNISLSMRLALYGADTKHSEIADSYNNIGLVYDNMGDYSKAIEYHMKSLKMAKAVYGADVNHREIATSYNNIGMAYNNMGDYKQALEYYLKSLDMRLNVYGPEAIHMDNHAHIANSYSNIGLAYESVGECDKALDYSMKCLNMYTTIYGEGKSHANIASCYSNIGLLYNKLGEYNKASDFFAKSLAMDLDVYGDDTHHVHIATDYNHLALASHRLAEYTSALRYNNKAMEIFKAVYGKNTNHLHIATSYKNIADVYADSGDYAQSLHYHTSSLNMTKAIQGENACHINMASGYHKLGRLYRKVGQYADSMLYETSALAQLCRSNATDPNLLCSILVGVSVNFERSSEYKNAKSFALLAFKQLPTSYCKDVKADICYLLGVCCLYLNEKRKCWRYLYSALCYYDSIPLPKWKMFPLAQVHLYISYLLLDLGHVSQSIEHSELALALTDTVLADQENVTPECRRLRKKIKNFIGGVYAALTLYTAGV